MAIADLLTAANLPPVWRAFILQAGGLRSDEAIEQLERWPSWQKSGLKLSKEVGEPLLAVAAIAYATMVLRAAVLRFEAENRLIVPPDEPVGLHVVKDDEGINATPVRRPFVRFADVAAFWSGLDVHGVDAELLEQRTPALADHAWAGLLEELAAAELGGQRNRTSHPRGRRSTSTSSSETPPEE